MYFKFIRNEKLVSCFVFSSSYTNTSGSLGERQMLLEHELIGECFFLSFPKVSPVFLNTEKIFFIPF